MGATVAARIARRELRGGIRGFWVFFICLMLGVGAIAIIGSLRAAIQTGLQADGAEILGGDVEIELTYRFATDEERQWMQTNAESLSEIADFRSLATTIAPPETRERALSQVKAVDNLYPIYGEVGLEPQIPLSQALATVDGLPGMVAEPTLIARLGLEVGDHLKLGDQEYELRAALTSEPDSSTAGFGFGPRVIVTMKSLDGSGLLGEGTLFNALYRLKVAPDTDLSAMREELRREFEGAGMRWTDRRKGAPGLDFFVQRMGSFLVLVGLAGLAVGGVGVAAAVKAYLDRKTDTIATLKTLGASSGTIFTVYLIQIGLLAAVGILCGVAIGAVVPATLGPFLAQDLPVPAEFGIYRDPLIEAALYGTLTALVFSIWPLSRAVDIRAASLFRNLTDRTRRLPRPNYLALVIVLAGALVLSSAWFSGVPALALWSAFGVIASLIALALSAQIARFLSAKASRLARGRPALRLALGSVGGPGGETASVVLSLGLGLTVLATVGQIDINLRQTIMGELPSRAPAYFFVDIQKDQIEEFHQIADNSGIVTTLETAPMLRGIITRINDRPAREVVGGHWALRGDRGVTYSATELRGGLSAGEWWPQDYDGPPLMSFSAEEAGEMGLKLGDRVTVNVLGRDLTATIASLRNIDFSDMGINFLMVLNPSALAAAPHTYIATAYTPPEEAGELLRQVGNAFPNVTAISVREGIERAAQTVGNILAAIRWGASATLLTGFVVLIGAAAAGEQRRSFESAVLKTLGASRARILASFAMRSAILGMAAGAVAIIAGGVAGWAVMRFVMEAEFTFNFTSAAIIIAAGAVMNLVAGLLFALRPLSAKPASVLRARE